MLTMMLIFEEYDDDDGVVVGACQQVKREPVGGRGEQFHNSLSLSKMYPNNAFMDISS